MERLIKMNKLLKMSKNRSATLTIFITTVLASLAGCGGNDSSSSAQNNALAPEFKFTTTSPSGFVTFESGQVRPLAMSADGKKKFLKLPRLHWYIRAQCL